MMKVKTLTKIISAKGIIPAGKIIEIPVSVMEKLKGKVIPIYSYPLNRIEAKTPARESGGFNSKPDVIWRNPFPQGEPGVRRASLEVIIDAMLYGLPINTNEDEGREINEAIHNILSGYAKLEDLRRLLGRIH